MTPCQHRGTNLTVATGTLAESHSGHWWPHWAPELGQGTQGGADSLDSHLHLLSHPQEAPVDGKEVSRSREAGGLGTAHLILVSWDYK